MKKLSTCLPRSPQRTQRAKKIIYLSSALSAISAVNKHKINIIESEIESVRK